MCELCFEFHCMIVAILQLRGYFSQAAPLLYANFSFKLFRARGAGWPIIGFQRGPGIVI